jgi:hypothetical protein
MLGFGHRVAQLPTTTLPFVDSRSGAIRPVQT